MGLLADLIASGALQIEMPEATPPVQEEKSKRQNPLGFLKPMEETAPPEKNEQKDNKHQWFPICPIIVLNEGFFGKREVELFELCYCEKESPVEIDVSRYDRFAQEALHQWVVNRAYDAIPAVEGYYNKDPKYTMEDVVNIYKNFCKKMIDVLVYLANVNDPSQFVGLNLFIDQNVADSFK